MNRWIAFIQVEGFYIKSHQPLLRGLGPAIVVRDGQVLEADNRSGFC